MAKPSGRKKDRRDGLPETSGQEAPSVCPVCRQSLIRRVHNNGTVVFECRQVYDVAQPHSTTIILKAVKNGRV